MPDLLSAPAATTSFDSLPEEIKIKIFKMAAFFPVDDRRYDDHSTHPGYDHHFIQEVLFNVSTRFRRIATDFSPWKGEIRVFTKPDFRELDFAIQRCLNSETTSMDLLIEAPPPLGTVTLPNRYLIEMATKFPNLEIVMIWKGNFEEDIPAPWLIVEEAPTIIVRDLLAIGQ